MARGADPGARGGQPGAAGQQRGGRREQHQAAPEGSVGGGLQRERAGGGGALRQGAQGLHGGAAHGGGHGGDHEEGEADRPGEAFRGV